MIDLRKQYGFITKISVWFDSKSAIILTMGKVGTLTICNSLESIGIKHVHPHSMRFTRPGVHFLSNVRLTPLQRVFYAYKTFTKRLKVFVWLSLSKEITIVSGVRDPYSRSISAFLEQAHYLDLDITQMTFEQLYEVYKKHYNLRGTLEWFDKEINKVFGIDIYNHEFDFNKGFQVVKSGKYRIFTYRIDFLNSLENELRTFIRNPKYKTLTTNKTTLDENYEKLKANIRFSKEEIKYVSESKYMHHFYTKSEINKLGKKWVKNESAV